LFLLLAPRPSPPLTKVAFPTDSQYHLLLDAGPVRMRRGRPCRRYDTKQCGGGAPTAPTAPVHTWRF